MSSRRSHRQSISRLKILAVLGAALALSHFLTKEVFLGYTPRFNPRFMAKIKNIPQYVTGLSKQNNTSFNNNSLLNTDVATIPVKQVSKGVFAGERGQIKYYQISESQLDWDEIVLTKKNGEKIILRYPKGQPPTQAILNIIQSE